MQTFQLNMAVKLMPS